MNAHSEIDETLRKLGSTDPPPGLAARVEQQLWTPRRSFFFFTVPQAIAACAVAASLAVSAVVFEPALRHRVLPHHTNAQTLPLAETPRVVPVAGGFGAASAVHVPVAPVPVEPTPVNHGRGRSRSGLPAGLQAPLPRGVATPNSIR